MSRAIEVTGSGGFVEVGAGGASIDITFHTATGGGGGGATNLTVTVTSTTVTVTSDTGTDATIPAATSTDAGVLTAADKSTIDGLGDAASLDVGTMAGTVAAGDDSRFSDVRTPTAHAASHTDGGTDEIALDASQITTGLVGVARLGSGTADATTFLRGDQTWQAAGGSETLPASIIDAKGDLLVGTAADTAARLAVGANGTSPIADSGSATGLLWGRSLAAPVPYKTGLWYSSPRNAVGTYSFAGGYIRMHPFVPHSTLTIDRIACYVTATTGGKARLGIYRGDGADGYAGSLVVDAGEVDTATTGDKIATCSATLQAGALYWFAANNNVATAFAHWGGYGADAYAAIHAWGSTAPISGPSSFLTCYMAYSYGPLPSTATPTPWNIGPPYLIVRAA